jgi:hypothetical protein
MTETVARDGNCSLRRKPYLNIETVFKYGKLAKDGNLSSKISSKFLFDWFIKCNIQM